MNSRFTDRSEAGRALAERLGHLAGRDDVIVLALPRGGVPVAFQIAEALSAPLDVLNVRKLGVPWHPELAMGAVASGGISVLNEDVIESCRITTSDLEKVMSLEKRELEKREQRYREGRPPAPIRDRTVVLVDDGVATGSTMRAAVSAVRRQAPAKLIVAVPVATPSVVRELSELADDVVCPMEVDPLYAIGLWYVDFAQVADDEVRDLLHRANEREAEPEVAQVADH